jgi:hypothetical protein
MQYAGLPAGRELAVVDPGDDTVQLAQNAAATVSSRAKRSWLIALDLARDALNGR